MGSQFLLSNIGYGLHALQCLKAIALVDFSDLDQKLWHVKDLHVLFPGFNVPGSCGVMDLSVFFPGSQKTL